MTTSSSTETPLPNSPEYSRLDELAMEWEPESNSPHLEIGALCAFTREESLFIPPQTDDQEALNKEMMQPEMEPTNKTPSKPAGNEILWTVRKRDSRIVSYNNKCIIEAVDRAYFSHMGTHAPQHFLLKLVSFVEQSLFGSNPNVCVWIENVQDAVENTLMQIVSETELPVAKGYIAYRERRRITRDTCKGNYDLKGKIMRDHGGVLPKTPWGELGYVTFQRTYARGDEKFADTIARVLNAAQNDLKVGFTPEELKKAYMQLLMLKGSVSGRFLWQLGTPTVAKHGFLSLQNCAFTNLDKPVEPFLFIFDALMLGCGVGVSVEHEQINKLPPVRTPVLDHWETIQDVPNSSPNLIQVLRNDVSDADFIIPDKREGWVQLLRLVLEAFFVTGRSFTYSAKEIRKKGVSLKGFGGVSSGPQDLCKGIEWIVAILQARQGQRLSSVDCLDIVDIIGFIVVAGNIRRSAIIVLGDADDEDFLKAKQWENGIPNWRAMSNNSVVCSDTSKLSKTFWENFEGGSEPYGIINRELARSCGRSGRPEEAGKYPDPYVDGVNPCAEQFLESGETCCLAEIFLPNITSVDELKEVATTLYRICKHSLTLPCRGHTQTNNVVHKNMRMGIGVTGYMQVSESKKMWLPHLYEYLRELDTEYSKKHSFPTSIKLTTVKPSGTLSLLAGVTPGVHPGFSEYYIRRIRMAHNSPLVEVCKEHKYPIEYVVGFDGERDLNTKVVSFPCKLPSTTVFNKDVSAIDQLEVVKRVQHEYSDNAVSCTVYYSPQELPLIQNWMKDNFEKYIKGVSFLLRSEHGFKQAPYEEITEDEYAKLSLQCVPIVDVDGIVVEDDDTTLDDCPKGSCPIK